jgi:hypothetical protein
MAATLYSFPNNPRAQRILIAAQYSGAKINVKSSVCFLFIAASCANQAFAGG